MKLFGQVVFWIAVIVFLTLLFGQPNSSYAESFFFVSMLLPVIIGTSYFFNTFLVPRYLFQKKVFKFILYSFYMLVISAWLSVLVVMLALVVLANYQYENMNPITTNVLMLGVTLYSIVFLYGFILLVMQSFMSQQKIKTLEEAMDKQKTECLIVRADRKQSKIPLEEIAYIESLGDYVKIMTTGKSPIITKEKISKLEERLPPSFLRIHRSFIVNSEKIITFTKEEIQLKDNVQLPISRTYKKNVIHTLGG